METQKLENEVSKLQELLKEKEYIKKLENKRDKLILLLKKQEESEIQNFDRTICEFLEFHGETVNKKNYNKFLLEIKEGLPKGYEVTTGDLVSWYCGRLSSLFGPFGMSMHPRIPEIVKEIGKNITLVKIINVELRKKGMI